MLTGNRITFSFVTCLYSGSLRPFLTCVSVSVHAGDAHSHKYSGLNACHSLLLNVFAPISAPWPTFSTSPLNLSGSWKDRTISGEQACDFAHSTKQKMIQFYSTVVKVRELPGWRVQEAALKTTAVAGWQLKKQLLYSLTVAVNPAQGCSPCVKNALGCIWCEASIPFSNGGKGIRSLCWFSCSKESKPFLYHCTFPTSDPVTAYSPPAPLPLSQQK